MLVTSVAPLKVYLFDGGVVIFGSVNKKKRSDFDMPADDEVGHYNITCGVCEKFFSWTSFMETWSSAKGNNHLTVLLAEDWNK